MSHPCRTCRQGRCCLSRRRFLGAGAGLLSAGALAAPLLSPAAAAAPPASTPPPEPVDDPGAVIPARSLRPQPLVRLLSATVRLKPPYWLGWPGTSYDLEGMKRQYQLQAERAARRNRIALTTVAEPLEDDAAVDAFARRVQTEAPDGVLLTLQHMGAWHWLDRISQAAARIGVPTILFAPVGTAFTGHLDAISRRPGVHVVSSLDFAAVEQAMRMVVAKRMFEATRVLVIAGDRRGETVLPVLGTKVRNVPRRVFPERFDLMPATREVLERKAYLQDTALRIVEPSGDDLINSARAYTTAKRLLAEEDANALSMDCLGMVARKDVPTPPCGSWTMLQDEGVTAGCEADLFGALSLMLTSYLFQKPGFMNDPVPETAHNHLIVAHCTSGTRLRGFDQPAAPVVLRSHSESDLGVSTQVLWPLDDKATLVRFNGPDEMIVDTGTVVENIDTPPAGGCRTSVALAMDRVGDSRDVLGFHQVVFHGDHRRDLEAFGQLYGIRVVHSPEHRSEELGAHAIGKREGQS